MKEKSESEKTGTCIYCGEFGVVTDDHTPPKNLFPEPRPSNLITVPACDECHKPWSTEDDYFRLKVGSSHDAKDHPSAKANIPKILRSLERPQARGFAQSHLHDFVQVNIMTDNGIFVEQRTAYDVDMNRIVAVVKRTVRGLFYTETGKRLPDTHDIAVVTAQELSDQEPVFTQEFLRTMVDPLRHIPPKVLGDNVFQYRYVMGNFPVSVWKLVYYGRIPFICMISTPPSGQRT